MIDPGSQAVTTWSGDPVIERALAPAAPEHQLLVPIFTAQFTTRDLAMFVHRHSEGKEQFDRVLAAVKAAPELVRLGTDGRGQERFTSRAMLDTEQRLERATAALDASRRHGVADRHRDAALARGAARGMILSPEQRSALEHVTKGHAPPPPQK